MDYTQEEIERGIELLESYAHDVEDWMTAIRNRNRDSA